VGEEIDVQVRDFRLPLQGSPNELSLRQIQIGAEFRITELWWALYVNGQRSDVWYFSAKPDRTENKFLSNDEIEAAGASGSDSLELRVRGIMFRPQGAWWVTGKVFSFSRCGDTLTLSRVRNAFGFFRSYEVGGPPPPITVLTEGEVRGRFETRSYDSVPDEILRGCGFQDPLLIDNWEFNWVGLERTASCVTKKAGARISYRGLGEPSFVERGGRPLE
jgi:hypothetical protein